VPNMPTCDCCGKDKATHGYTRQLLPGHKGRTESAEGLPRFTVRRLLREYANGRNGGKSLAPERGRSRVKQNMNAKLRQAAALALVGLTTSPGLFLLFPSRTFAAGWYLMAPPTQADVEPSCMGDPTTLDRIRALVRRQRSSYVQFQRCLPKAEALADNAPLSQWYQLGSYATVKDCENFKNFYFYKRNLPQSQWRTFTSVHRKDLETLMERDRSFDEELKLLENDKLLQDEYSNLPKEIRDQAADYVAGHFDRRDFEEKSRANDQLGQIFVDFVLSHRQKYPIASRVFALNNIDELQAQALQCIATDDPRLKESGR
jgi:hypothetical protein